MKKQIKSHVKNGHAHFKHTGRYNEITTNGISTLSNTNDKAPSILGQNNLAPKGNKSAVNAWKDLGWFK